MAIIGGLALLTWLALPAIRIWRDPTLLVHNHEVTSQVPGVPLTLKMETPGGSASPGLLTASTIRLVHETSFWSRYRQALLGQRRSDTEKFCPSWASFQKKIETAAPAQGYVGLSADSVVIHQ